MVEGIADDGVVLGEKGLKDTTVGVEACGIEDGIFSMEVFADGGLKLLVKVLASADEAYARHTIAAAVHGVLGSLDKARVVGKTQIVVGAEVQHSLSAYIDGSLLGAFDEAFVFVKSCFADGRELVLKMLLEFSVHGE